MSDSGVHSSFFDLSCALTGFDRVELESTGVAPVYRDFLAERFPRALDGLLDAWSAIVRDYPPPERETGVRQVLLTDDELGPFTRAVTLLWYTANWYPPPDDWSGVYGGRPNDAEVALGDAYPEGLEWKAAGAHPVAAKPTGYGTWSLPPVAG